MKKHKELIENLMNENLNDKEIKDLISILYEEYYEINPDKKIDENMSFADKLADRITGFAGSWKFIIIIFLFLLLWILINTYIIKNLDPFPFVLLNLLLSCFSALQAPIILMSQNRNNKKDTLRSANDYKTDLKSEIIIRELYKEIKNIKKNQTVILKYINSNKKRWFIIF